MGCGVRCVVCGLSLKRTEVCESGGRCPSARSSRWTLRRARSALGRRSPQHRPRRARGCLAAAKHAAASRHRDDRCDGCKGGVAMFEGGCRLLQGVSLSRRAARTQGVHMSDRRATNSEAASTRRSTSADEIKLSTPAAPPWWRCRCIEPAELPNLILPFVAFRPIYQKRPRRCRPG